MNPAYLFVGSATALLGTLFVIVGSFDKNKAVIIGGAVLLVTGTYLVCGGDTVLARL